MSMDWVHEEVHVLYTYVRPLFIYALEYYS